MFKSFTGKQGGELGLKRTKQLPSTALVLVQIKGDTESLSLRAT